MNGLDGSRVLVTGSTTGIGHAIAAAFVMAGARVVITGRDLSRAQRAAAALGGGSHAATGVALDVTDAGSIDAVVGSMVAELGGIDVLVNNAGLGVRHINEHYLAQPQNFWEADHARFRALWETNVDGYFLCSARVVPEMLRAGRGRLINVSINEATMRFARFIPYGPSRAATDAMTYAMAAELEGTGVTANLLAPGGPVDTRMITAEASPGFRAQLLDPAIMGPPACWLASEAAAAVTGQKIVAKDFVEPAGEPASGGGSGA
jgi:NAD(P)-dependent dehydrogenase (short-subunit alcohol dehydrogenase family)